MANFESYSRRIDQINAVLKEYGFKDLDEAKEFALQKGVDAEAIVRDTQPIAFENACWAYTLGAALALKKGCRTAAEAAETIGVGLQVQLPISVRLAWGTVIWQPCCCGRRPSASAF